MCNNTQKKKAAGAGKDFTLFFGVMLHFNFKCACTVLLHCPICAEIRTVDSQSGLRILLYRVMIIRKMQYNLPRVIYTIQIITIPSQHKRQEQDM